MNKKLFRFKKTLVGIFIIASLCVIIRYIVIPNFIFPMKYKDQVFTSAVRHNVDPLLIFAVMKAESKFNPNALSRQGAKGLMQIMDKTGEWAADELNIQDFTSGHLFDPAVNIDIGSWYLGKLMNQYEGDIPTLLAAYNAGTGNVYKWRNNKEYCQDGLTIDYIPFGETRRYIKKVIKNLNIYRYLY